MYSNTLSKTFHQKMFSPQILSPQNLPNSSLVSTDYRYTGNGYLTYNTDVGASATFTLRNNGTTVLGINSSNNSTFSNNL